MKKGKEIILVTCILSVVIFGMTFPGISEIFGTIEGTLPKCLFIFAYFYSVPVISFCIVTFAVYVTVCMIGNCVEIPKILLRGFAILCQSHGLILTIFSGDKAWMADQFVLATAFLFIGNLHEVVFRIGEKVYCYNGGLTIEEVVSKEADEKGAQHTLLKEKTVSKAGK